MESRIPSSFSLLLHFRNCCLVKLKSVSKYTCSWFTCCIAKPTQHRKAIILQFLKSDKSSTTFAITGTVATTEGYFNIFVSSSPLSINLCPRVVLRLSLCPALYSKMSSPMDCTLPTGSHLHSASWDMGKLGAARIKRFSKMCFWQGFEFSTTPVSFLYSLSTNSFHCCSNGISILLIPKVIDFLNPADFP